MIGLTWNLDPVIFRLGPLALRYYSLTFAVTLCIAYLFLGWQMKRGGISESIINRFTLWQVFAVIVGARLGHCLFYEPSRYLADPLQILFFWRGGLASHGATVGITLTIIFFALARKLKMVDLADRFAFSIAVGASGVRLGNFLKSEIVGRPTSLPWGVKFPAHETNPVPRHPSQLYEFAMGLAILGALVLIDRYAGKEKRPRGLMIGSVLVLYFTARFIVEFFKEYQALSNSYLTMGQYLSIPCVIGGSVMLGWCWRHRHDDTSDEMKMYKRRAQEELTKS